MSKVLFALVDVLAFTLLAGASLIVWQWVTQYQYYFHF